MATIDSWNIIAEIIKGNGYYETDARVSQIVEYTNAYGRQAWGVTWINESPDRQHRYEIETGFVRSPTVIWKAS